MVENQHVDAVRAATRRLIRELGFLDKTIAGTEHSPSGAHAIIEIGRTPGITSKTIARLLRLEKSTVSRLVQNLEKRGDIELRRLDTDGRQFGMHLTETGRKSLARINAVGDRQVRGALSRLDGIDPGTVADAMAAYGAVLWPDGEAADLTPFPVSYEVLEGYQTGMIGDIAALHARTHAPIVGSGPAFESVVSAAMAEFMPRIGRPMNNSWSIVEDGAVIASITIDGEDLGNNIAHLRWFILSERLRGKGLGKVLLKRALDHCDALGFDEIHLWTLKGLDAARYLYEKNGFELAEEYIGDQWGKAVTEQKFTRRKP